MNTGDIFAQGQADYRAGKSKSDCPYVWISKNAEVWLDGWQAADIDAQIDYLNDQSDKFFEEEKNGNN